MPIAIGPCVVTADELDPQAMFVQVKVDDDDVLKGNLNGAATSLFELIAAVSQHARARARRRVRARPVPAGRRRRRPSRRLWPGALIELAAEGIGTLRNRLGAR